MGEVRGYAAVMLALAALIAVPARAGAAQLETVLQDDAQLLHRPEAEVRRSLTELRQLGVDRIRVTAGWSVLTRDADAASRPRFDATNPAAYEQERWRNLDRLIVLADYYGFKAMVDVAFWAPHWASRDPAAGRGRTEVDPDAYAEFATAVARRYSGTFVIPGEFVPRPSHGPLRSSRDEQYLDANYGSANPGGGTSLSGTLGTGWLGGEPDLEETLGGVGVRASRPLPKVDVLTLWNEPNFQAFLRPQWERYGHRFVPRSPHLYRALVQRAYPAIKAVRPDATVLIGATSFTGSYSGRGTAGVPPLRFLREFACVDRRFQPLHRSGCDAFTTVPGDGWSHHPYTMQTFPDVHASRDRPDDVPIADLPRLASQIDRLVAAGRLAPGVRNLWVTEYGYETNPPVPDGIWTVSDQARFLTWAEYLAARVPTNHSFAQFLLRDLPPGAFRVGTSRHRAFGQWQSGLETEDGTPKVAAWAFRAGLFVQRLPGHRLRLWGRLRLGEGTATVVIERRSDSSRRWITLTSLAVAGRESFERVVPAPRRHGQRYRLRYLDGTGWQAGMPVRAVR